MTRRTRGLGAAHEERATQIADAVLAVVADGGLAAVSLTTVAARAGVSAGRVQHYFPTKNALLEAAFDRANALSSARIAAALGVDVAWLTSDPAGEPDDPSAAQPRAVLTALLCALIPDTDERRLQMRVRQSYTALALVDEAIAARLRHDYRRLHDTLGNLLASDGVTDAQDTAIGLVALAEGLAYYVLVDVQTAERARRQVVEAIVAVYRRD